MYKELRVITKSLEETHKQNANNQVLLEVVEKHIICEIDKLQQELVQVQQLREQQNTRDEKYNQVINNHGLNTVVLGGTVTVNNIKTKKIKNLNIGGQN
jgi:hypothetical protein